MTTLTKRTGKCTEDAFWEVAEEIGWNRETDCGAVKSQLLDMWDDEFICSFRGILGEKVSALYQLVEDYERSERVSCECGDDGFGDLMNDCVGRGREEYERCVADPSIVVARGQASDYTENYGYCFPYEPRAPKLTLEQALEKMREEMRGDEDTLDPDAVLMCALEMILGDKAYKDPRYYGAWARRQGRELEALMDGEFGAEFGMDLVKTVSAFTDVAKNEPGLMLDRAEETKAALERIEERRRAIIKAFEERLDGLRQFSYWGCRNMVTDIEENFGG